MNHYPVYPTVTATPMPQSPDDGADERNDDGGGDAEWESTNSTTPE